MRPEVEAKLDTLPSSPGVYLFRGEPGVVLYVGKARSLRSRVRSYFQPGGSDSRFFISLLDEQLHDIETYVTKTEKEAALLENQLIKEHQPRYNFKLRDDKEFLSLRLRLRTEWPRLEVVRRPKPDGSRYFGPYHSATAARQTLRLVNRYFQLRTCTDSELRSRKRPCLQYQIRRCPGPCVFDVDKNDYRQQVEHVALFLDGRHDELVQELDGKMRNAAETLEFERAALYRDQIRAVERVREDQRVAVVKDVDQDVVGFYRQADKAELTVLIIRGGKLVSVRNYDLSGVRLPDDELVARFLGEYYQEGTYLPDEVLLPVEVEAMNGWADLLTDRRTKQGGRRARVKFLVPRRGQGADLIRMAMENAVHAFEEKARAKEDVEERLGHLQERLRLRHLPRQIECLDISHTGGEDPVGALVALRDGVPDRARYRSFNIKRYAGGDDYGAMYEVLARRFRRGREKEQGWENPDLLVVDGGKGQLNVALKALSDIGVDDVPVVALAKEKETAYGDKVVDRIYTPGAKNPINIRESHPALQMLALARDEAHRASNHHRKKRAKKRRLRSDLDAVPGIGPKTRQKLLSNLGSLRAIRLADEETLIRAGATKAQAKAIRQALGVETLEMAPSPEHSILGNPELDGATAEQAEEEAVDNAFSEAGS
ncbi:MAG: excinuclease ABC subunit UvrC [Myxococcota bacterium]